MQAVFYRDPDGNEPVLDVLKAPPDRKRAVIENQLDRLNMQEPDKPPLPQPWTSQIEGELREFRRPLRPGALPGALPALGQSPNPAAPDPQDHGQGAQARHRDCEGALGRLQATDGRRQAHTAAGRRARRAQEPLATVLADMLS